MIKQDIYALEKANIELKYKLKMECLVYERENDRLHHERELERDRIKSAEIRKSFERREHSEFANRTAFGRT